MIDPLVLSFCGRELLKEAMNLSFGNLKGATRTLRSGVDAEAHAIARSKPLIRGGFDETPVPRIKDMTNSIPSASHHPDRAAPAIAATDSTGAISNPLRRQSAA